MRLTLVAGSGALVPPVIEAALQKADALQVIDLVGGRTFAADRVEALSLRDAAALMSAVRRFDTTHLLFAGGVRISDTEREGIIRAFGMAGRLAGSLGDIGLAGLVLAYCRANRVKLLGAHEIVPELLAPAGAIAGPAVPAEIAPSLRKTLAAARAVGAIDLGQSVVMAGNRPIAAEDAGGTDALLARIGQLRAAGLAGDGRAPLILAKAVKPRQPRFADLPAIGPQSVVNAAAAGIAIIVVEAGRSLLLERAKLAAEAARLGVSIVGMRRG